MPPHLPPACASRAAKRGLSAPCAIRRGGLPPRSRRAQLKTSDGGGRDVDSRPRPAPPPATRACGGRVRAANELSRGASGLAVLEERLGPQKKTFAKIIRAASRRKGSGARACDVLITCPGGQMKRPWTQTRAEAAAARRRAVRAMLCCVVLVLCVYKVLGGGGVFFPGAMES